MGRILAIDYGRKRCGIAVTDPLKIIANGLETVATHKLMDFLKDYLETTSVINLYDFARMLATEVVDDPALADVVFSDRDEPMREGAERIGSLDTERIIALLN